MRNFFFRWLVGILLLGLGILLTWGFIRGRRDLIKESEGDRPIERISRVATEGGDRIITLDQITRTKANLKVWPLQEARIPSAAIIWWNGQAWVYVEKEPNRFVRRKLAAVNNKDLIVITGAELLLSEELSSEIKDIGE
jgi:hypothetical protein